MSRELPPLPDRPHHDGSALHVAPASPRLGDSVALRLRVPAGLGAVRDVRLRIIVDHEPRFVAARDLGVAESWAWWEAEAPLANPVLHYRWLVLLDDDRHLWVTSAGCTLLEPLDREDFRLAADTDVPAWAADAVLYQVFPDRFARSSAADGRAVPDWAEPADWDEPVVARGPSTPRQFYGGDLDGVREHLDHLEALGVTVLYLTPFFPARSNHRYDASSFDRVDPLLGGDDALVRLVEAAHARGIRVLGDLTSNHCGDTHEWFLAAHRTPDAPESAFFFWLDDEHETYESWLGHASLPKFDWSSPELRRRFLDGPDSVVGRWLRPPFSLDGWRIDVANMTGRLGAEDLNAEVRRTLRTTMREIEPDTLLLAEYTGDAAEDFQGDAWHGAMTYPAFTRPVWEWLSRPGSPSSYFGFPLGAVPTADAEDFQAAVTRFTAGYPWPMRCASLSALDSHDVPRFANNALPGTIPVAVGLSVALPGIPMVWAGDELGLHGADGEDSRTPIPWASLDEHADLIGDYAAVLGLRHSSSALRSGGIRWLAAEGNAVALIREDAAESVLVLATRAAATVSLPRAALPGEPEPLLGPGRARLSGDLLVLEADGISFTAWRLPGVRTPPGRGPASAGEDTVADTGRPKRAGA